MNVVERDFVLEFLYGDVTTVVSIEMNREHVRFISGEEDAKDVLDAEKDLTCVDYNHEELSNDQTDYLRLPFPSMSN